MGLEIVEYLKSINTKIDNLLISVGGGGLISGVSSYVKQFYPKIKIIGVEPENANGLNQSLRANKPLNNNSDFSGIIPNIERVAILNGNIKFLEEKIESKENLSYFTNIKNRGVSFEKSLLARTISMGAEASGAGFKISTPYVEKITAIEVEFSLLKKSDLSKIIPKKTISWYRNFNQLYFGTKARLKNL